MSYILFIFAHLIFRPQKCIFILNIHLLPLPYFALFQALIPVYITFSCMVTKSVDNSVENV